MAKVNLYISRIAQNRRDADLVAGHWFWAVPILLAVSLIALPLMDRYAPTRDEFASMINVGWAANTPYSPVEVLESLARNSPGQAPLYYLTLNLWGHLVGQDIALARVLTIYIGLLFLALSYRLAFDFVAPVGGLIALVMLVSNAFLNLYLPIARMYQLFAFVTVLALWTYLRILYCRREPKLGDYVGFFVSCIALASTHAASILLFVAVGAFHLLAVPKGKRWLRIGLCASLALLVYSPWAILLISKGLPRFHYITARDVHDATILIAFAEALSNGFIVLMVAPVAGLAVAWRRGRIAPKSHHLLILYYLAVVLIAHHTVGVFQSSRLRYLQPGMVIYPTLFAAAGIYALYRVRPWLILLVLLWGIAGIAYPKSEHWTGYIPDVESQRNLIPYHSILRHARVADNEVRFVAYRVATHRLTRHYYGVRQIDLYSKGGQVDFSAVEELNAFAESVRSKALIAPAVWAIYQEFMLGEAEKEALKDTLEDTHYTYCGALNLANDTVVLKYQWVALACEEELPPLQADTPLINYQFLGARVIDNGERIAFVDEWRSKSDALPANLSTSYQLISESRERIAQLDLPFVEEGRPRQFTIDTGDAPKGTYRLTLIVYDRSTGERLTWPEGDATVPEFLTLAELEL